MKKEKSNLYLFLARRDKKGIRLLAKFFGEKQNPVRILTLEKFELPHDWQKNLEKIIYDSRMTWEAWLQSAETWDEFITSLEKRGFTNLNYSSHPEYLPATTKSLHVNTTHLPYKKTMLRKKN